MTNELGMNCFVALDTYAALMRLSCEVARDVAVMPKALITVWMLCSSKNDLRASMSL